MRGIIVPVGFLYCFTALNLKGPTFIKEPSGHVSFINTKGTEIRCTAQGLPIPTVQWLLQDSRPVSPVSELLEVKKDGTLVLLPFRQENYRSEIHDTIYRCTARNAVGTVSSREVRVKAALVQDYHIQVYDQYAIFGTTAVFRCHVPSSVRDYIRILEWKINNNITIRTSEIQSNIESKYVAFQTGELYVHQVTHTDSHFQFRCKTIHKLTGEKKISETGGRIVVTEPVGGMPPKIIDSKPKIWARHGQTVIIPCAAQGQPPPNYSWIRKGRKRAAKKMRVHQNLQGTLRVQSVTTEDSGRYVCFVNNSEGMDMAETELVITVPVEVNIEPHTLVVLTGESATLTCNQIGHPIDSVLWMKDLHHLTENGRIQFVGRNVLHIPTVWKEDQGMYQCFVYSSGTTEQAISQLTVGDIAPSLHETFNEQIKHPGQSVSFRCMSSGHPLPEITWHVNRKSITSKEKIKINDFVTSQGQVVSQINLTNVTPQDSGLYECVAQNNVGSVSHAARLNVYGPPGIRSMDNVTVVEGQNLYLECAVIGYPLESISWEKGGVHFPLTRRHQAYSNGTLVIHKVEKDYDEGYYTCVVRNKDGDSQQRAVAVIVTKPPKIIPFETQRVREGTHVALMCAINQGDPPFSLQWLKNGQRIMPEVDVTIQFHEMFTILSFSAIRRRHGGNYTCLASNTGGSVSHSALLIIDVPPRWIVEPQNASVILGQSVIVDCKAEGLPIPTIIWKRNKSSISKEFEPIYNSYNYILYGNGSLGIREAEHQNQGYYLCQANNNVGAALSKWIAITVHTPPQFDTPHTVKTFRLHSPMELICSATGELPLEVTWSRNGIILSNRTDDRFHFQFQETNSRVESILYKANVERNHTGLYICTAGNAYGVSEKKFQVIIQEVPAPPTNIKFISKTGRSLTVSWHEPFDGHSPIMGYIIHYKTERTEWNNVTISGTSTTATVSSLLPATQYSFCVQAENLIGKSNISEPVKTSTKEEAPGGSPVNIKGTATGPNSIKVSWEPPNKSLWNGNITGYYIGYKILSSNEPAIFKTIELTTDRELEIHLTNLQRSTEYSISVQAFNGQGTGPRSDEFVIQTLADVPPTTPVLYVLSSTVSSITLNWSQKRSFSSPITECVLHRKKEYGDWKDEKVISQTSTYTVSALECGTRYQFYMVCHNSVGRSEPSEVLQTVTTGAAPLSPSKEDFLQCNSSSSTLKLSAWQNGGCPISHFKLKLKEKHKSIWLPLESHLSPDESTYTVQSLRPGTWYMLQVTAHSSAGATEAQYEFQTLNETEVTEVQESHSSLLAPFYYEITFLIPVIASSIIIIIIILIGCIIFRRRTPYDSTTNSDASDSSKFRDRGLEAMALKDIVNNAANRKPISKCRDEAIRPISSVVPITGMERPRREPHCYATPYDTIPEVPIGDEESTMSVMRTLNRPVSRQKIDDNFYFTKQCSSYFFFWF